MVALPKNLITMTSDGFRSVDADGAVSHVRVRRPAHIKDRAKRARCRNCQPINLKSRMFPDERRSAEARPHLPISGIAI
jgi:hypothetical protein